MTSTLADKMVNVNLMEDTLLSLRLLWNQYDYASKDRIPPQMVLRDIPCPESIGEKQRIQTMRKGIELHKHPPKLTPRPPYTARLPITAADRVEYEKSIRFKRRKRTKLSRTAHADIPRRFPQQASRIMDLSLSVLAKCKITVAKNGFAYVTTTKLVHRDKSCILGKTRSKGDVSSRLARTSKKVFLSKSQVESIVKTQSNRISARKKKYPFLYDDEKPLPTRMQTGEKALVKRITTMMVEHNRGPAQLSPRKVQMHVPDIRWWRGSKRETGFEGDLDYALQRTYYPKLEAVRAKESTVRLPKRNCQKWTPYDLAKQIRKVKTLRCAQKQLAYTLSSNVCNERYGNQGYAFSLVPRFRTFYH